MSDKFYKEVVKDELSDVVELVSNEGRAIKLYHIDTIVYNDEGYVFFQPAEEIEGLEDDDVIILRLSEIDGKEVLLPIEDEALLDGVFEYYCRMIEEEESAAEAESMETEEFYCDGNCSECEMDCEQDDEEYEEEN